MQIPPPTETTETTEESSYESHSGPQEQGEEDQDALGQVTDQAGQAVQGVQDTAGQAAGQAQDAAGQVTDQAGQAAQGAQDTAQGAAQQAQDVAGGAAAAERRPCTDKCSRPQVVAEQHQVSSVHTGKTAAALGLDETRIPLTFPVLGNVDFGHAGPNLPMPVGVRAALDARQRTLSLLEPAVA